MKTSLKSFAAFVVTIGIFSMGAANAAFAAGHGSHGSSGSSHSLVNRGSHQFDKHDSQKYDHDRDRYRDWGRYNSWYSPWSYRYPSYPSCYTPSYCYESVPQIYAPQPCQEFCPSPPICEQEPIGPSYPEFCDDYRSYYGSNYYRPWFDKRFDRYKDRDYRKDRDEFKGHKDFSKLSHGNRNGKSQFSGGSKGSSGLGQMGKLAGRTGGMSGGLHGGRR